MSGADASFDFARAPDIETELDRLAIELRRKDRDGD